MKLSKNKILLLVGGLVVLALLVISPLPKILAQSLTPDRTNTVWSQGLGWFAMYPGSGENANATIDSTGNFSGYAWGKNIGWLNMTGVKVPMTGSVPAGGQTVTGTAKFCSVFVSGCSGTLKGDDQRGGWDGTLAMSPYVKVSADGKTLEGYAWSEYNTAWVDMTGLFLKVAPATTYSLSVTKVAGDTTGVVSVSPVNIGGTNVYPQATPATTVPLIAKNSAASPVPTCWTVDGVPVVAAAEKASSYTVTMNASHAVVVGCASVPPADDCSTDPTLCGCVGDNCTPPPGGGCSGNTCTCGTLADCDCDGTAVSPYSCTDSLPCNTIPTPPGCSGGVDEITDISIKTGNTTEGIVFNKTGGGSYPWSSAQFKVAVEPPTATIQNLTLKWDQAVDSSGGAKTFPSECKDSIKIIGSSLSSSCANAAPVSINGPGSYKLCFDNRCADTNGRSKFNGNWTVPLMNAGAGMSKNTTLYFSDSTQQ